MRRQAVVILVRSSVCLLLFTPMGCKSSSGKDDASISRDSDLAASSDAGDGNVPDGGASSPDAGSGPMPFTALHTYYLSPSGNDSNDGSSPTACGTNCGPWATPKHAVDCGDVIIAAKGDYSGQDSPFGTNDWGAVSNCPSTSGGIDGQGGVYFAVLLCAGPDLVSCTVTTQAEEPFRVDESNWAVEGFWASQPGNAPGGCYSATSETSSTLHHIAFVNDVASGCHLAGFDSYSYTSPGGVDQQAIVGVIAYNGAQSLGGGLCGSGISLIPVNGPDTTPGTHVFVGGTFSYANVNAPTGAGCNTDGEGLIFDSWGDTTYKYGAVAEQNMMWANGSAGFEAFPQGNRTSDDDAQIVLLNNTSYGNYQDPKNPGGAELFLNQIYPQSGSGSYKIEKNLFIATVSKPGGTGTGSVVGAAMDCGDSSYSCPANVIDISNNYIWNSSAPTTMTSGGENTQAFYSNMAQGASWPWGTNTYDDPELANPTGLPTTPPNCTGHASTTECMINAHVVSDLAPGGSAVGLGYQLPERCSADSYYPSWLKGVVYLTANGSSITEQSGLMTKPCGM